MNLSKAEKLVEGLLERYPRTRVDDHVLYRAYYYELTVRGLVQVDFATFFTYPTKFNGLTFATIERCRRRLQHYRPELKDDKVAKIREYKQEEFREYAKG